MKSWGFIITVFVFLLSFHAVSALEIESYKITAEPVDGNYVKNIIELTILNDKESALSQGTLTFAKDAEIESISDSYGEITYSTVQNTDSQKVSFTFTIPIKSAEKRILSIKTKTQNIIQKEGYFEYLLVIVPPKDIQSFVHILKLDKDAELSAAAQGLEEAEQEDFVLVPDAFVTETEQNIVIEWNVALQKDVPTVFLARFHQETGINYWKWFGIGVIILASGALFGVAGNRLYTQYKQNKALNATNILNEREKAVLDIIIKNPEIKQYEVVKQLGYTKSNMSKIIKRLEFRGLIAVKKEGKVRILNIGEQMKKQM